MDEHPIRLRVTSETCRRLVRAINDAETVARLTDLAGRVRGQVERDGPLLWRRVLIVRLTRLLKLNRPSRYLEVAGIFVIALSFALMVCSILKRFAKAFGLPNLDIPTLCTLVRLHSRDSNLSSSHHRSVSW
jgi:hypothetical protein